MVGEFLASMSSYEVESLASAALVPDMADVELKLRKDGFRLVIDVKAVEVASSRRPAVDSLMAVVELRLLRNGFGLMVSDNERYVVDSERQIGRASCRERVF